MNEREMEDLIETHADEFFPRKILKFKGRQGTFAGIGRYDLMFHDQFGNNILMELKAVPAKLEVAEQLVKYKQALEDKGEKHVIMWLVAPIVPRHVAEFLDRFGVEHTEIHEAEFRQVASRHNYAFVSESRMSAAPVATTDRSQRPKASAWSFTAASQSGSPEEFLGRCDELGKTLFSALFQKQKLLPNKTKITWDHQSGFSMHFYFQRLGFVEMVWGFPATNREGAATGQKLCFPFDFALKKGVSENFINEFGAALASCIQFTGGAKRPNIRISNFSDATAQALVEAIFQFAENAATRQ